MPNNQTLSCVFLWFLDCIHTSKNKLFDHSIRSLLSELRTVAKSVQMQVHQVPIHSDSLLSESLRGLLQAPTQATEEVEPANITFVNTPQALLDAIDADALDIVVTDHLDLTTLPLQSTSICKVGCDSPLGEISTTRSIRVRHCFYCPKLCLSSPWMSTVLALTILFSCKSCWVC